MELQSKTFVVVGGGSAGWLTANALLKSLPDYRVVLIEDPNIPTIGVGEGSTPALKGFFDLLGIVEQEWMPQCDATYKNGISFVNWSNNQNFNSYFHAFPSTIDNNTLAPFFYNCHQRTSGYNVEANPSQYFLTAKLSEQHKSPIPAENFPFEVNYGYHFDSAKLASFLSTFAQSKGIQHIKKKVQQVQIGSNKDISTLVLEDGEEIKGDIFFDCTGFNSVIANQMLNIPFVSYKDQLLNDTAIVVQTVETDLIRESQTISTAMNAGWRWQIPLSSRKGHGYVYSSEFLTKAEAEREFIDSISDSSTQFKTEPRFINFKLGRLDKFWVKNCVAIGLSQGFIEPLEATALFLIQQTVGKFIDYWREAGGSADNRNKFNNELTDLFDGIKDYVLLHYKLSGRTDTDYWRAIAEDVELSEELISLKRAWASGAHFRQSLQFFGFDKYYPVSSWYSIFSGSGCFPTELKEVKNEKFNFEKVQDFIRRASMNYSSHAAELYNLQIHINE
ncbi:tryptophan halogenase family protein [Thalassotalea agariperforans]